MEGFWTCKFIGVDGFGGGVATLTKGRFLGGDSGYLFMGTYTVDGATLNAQVHVKQHMAGIPNVMGRTEFDLAVTGTLNGSVIAFTGNIPGTPLQIKGELVKQSDLP